MVKLLQFYLQNGGTKSTVVLKKLCEENGIFFVKLGKFHNIRRSAWRHETLLKISRLLPAIKIQLTTSNNSDLQHVCTERFQCFLANIVLKTTSTAFQREKWNIGKCKDELMVAIDSSHFCLMLKVITGQTLFLMLMLTGTKQSYSGLIEEFEIRYDSLKSCDHYLVFDPSTWPQEKHTYLDYFFIFYIIFIFFSVCIWLNETATKYKKIK